MAPLWHRHGSYSLYFYWDEPHLRPHVAVRQGNQRVATLDIATGELLAGLLPGKVLRELQRLLAQHREVALTAFETALLHQQFPTLEESKTEMRKDEEETHD